MDYGTQLDLFDDDDMKEEVIPSYIPKPSGPVNKDMLKLPQGKFFTEFFSRKEIPKNDKKK